MEPKGSIALQQTNNFFKVTSLNKGSTIGNTGAITAGAQASFGGTMSLKDILSPNFNLHSATNKTSTSNGVNI